jgi:hypothetical protein
LPANCRFVAGLMPEMQEINFVYDSIYRAFRNQIAAKWGVLFFAACL